MLLADDSADDRLLIARALKALGTVKLIFTLEDGHEVIAYLEGQGPYADREKFPTPDLLLLDLKMPRVNGFEVLEWLRKHKSLKPLIAVLSSSEIPRSCSALIAILGSKPNESNSALSGSCFSLSILFTTSTTGF